MTERKRLRKAHRAYRKALLAENLLAEPLSFKAWLCVAQATGRTYRDAQTDEWLPGPIE
jgi:hypothetical protein